MRVLAYLNRVDFINFKIISRAYTLAENTFLEYIWSNRFNDLDDRDGYRHTDNQ